jgi:hypothetical protein
MSETSEHMRGLLRNSMVLSACLFALNGCGGTEHDDPQHVGGGSSSGATANQAGGNGSAGAHAGRSGSAGGHAGTGNGVGGTSSVGGLGSSDCSGTFATPALGLTEDAKAKLASPALSPDALTLFYTRTLDDQIGFRTSTRASLTAVFPAGAAVPELDAACQAAEGRSVDLSADGLRAYVACYSATAEPVGTATLSVAVRASLGAPFALSGAKVQVGAGAAISKDELTLFTSSDINPGFKPPLLFQRASLADAFGAGAAIPGLEEVNLTAPDPAPDGTTLYGGLMGNVVVTTRASADAPFAAPSVLFAPADATQQLGAPEVSQDCRRLFFVRQTSANGLTTSELMEAHR